MIKYVTEEIAHTEEKLEHQRQKRHAPSQLEEEIEQEVEQYVEHEELEHERKKRQVLNLRQSSHLKWDLLIPYKFDGNHSKLIFCFLFYPRPPPLQAALLLKEALLAGSLLLAPFSMTKLAITMMVTNSHYY